MLKTKKIAITIGSIFLFIFIIVALWFLRPLLLERLQVNGSRPDAAYQMPDFSGDITGVRVTVVPRDIDAHAIYGDLFEENGNVYQLYYGYMVNGKWTDIPHENYDLRGLKNKRKTGFEAAGNDHVVVVGPYIMLALSARGDAEDAVVDTVNSEAFSLTEYYRSETPCFFFRENMVAYDTEDYNCWISPSFLRWHFITLVANEIPENYSVTISSHSKKTNELLDERTYTYEDIMAVLNGT